MTLPPMGPDREPWLAAGVPSAGSSGGGLRAAHLLRSLVERVDATVIPFFGRRGLPSLALEVAWRSRLWRSPLSVASARLVPAAGLALLRGRVDGRLLDLHDHPRLQLEAFGIAVPEGRQRALDELVRRNQEAFARLSIPSASFAELCELPADQVVVATNGTDASTITPAPLQDEPVVAMISGAAPGRGIELLVEAMERVRGELPRAQLRLALAPTGPESRRYLATFVHNQVGRPWLRVQRVPYPQLSAFLGVAQILVIPHPPGAYHDVATPVKLFDGMASGRPVVVTPRRETAQIVRSTGAGVVAGDGPDELADAISHLLADEARRREMGAAARRAAIELYDWRVISSRLADEVLGRG